MIIVVSWLGYCCVLSCVMLLTCGCLRLVVCCACLLFIWVAVVFVRLVGYFGFGC